MFYETIKVYSVLFLGKLRKCMIGIFHTTYACTKSNSLVLYSLLMPNLVDRQKRYFNLIDLYLVFILLDVRC